MRKIVFQAHADTVGTDTAELVCFSPVDGVEVTDQHIDNYCDDFGMEHWDAYEPNTGGPDDDYEDSEDYHQYCGAWWEEYNPDEHNRLLRGGEEGYEEDFDDEQIGEYGEDDIPDSE